MPLIEIGFLHTIYGIGRDVLAYIRPRIGWLSKSEIVELRMKWEKEFEERVLIVRRDKLRSDVIIRDMRRVNQYPEIGKKNRGIYPCFPVDLIDTYHRGIQVGIRVGSLTKDKHCGDYRYVNHKASEEQHIKVILVGYIPFENIQYVDWNGDEYYTFPHIYCHFGMRQQGPYDRLVFCQERWLDEHPHYS